METERIAALLAPYNDALDDAQLAQVATYLELLLRWNARTNLTAVRDPESIVTRHFGESLFAARVLLPERRTPTTETQRHREEPGLDAPASDQPIDRSPDHPIVFDVGSGAGFPGLPLKIWAPGVRLTLIESQNKKATFLREVARALNLDSVEVFNGRAETLGRTADLVTMRAVEKFEAALPVAARLVGPGGRLALLIGRNQAGHVAELVPGLKWSEAIEIPGSEARVVLVGTKESTQESRE